MAVWPPAPSHALYGCAHLYFSLTVANSFTLCLCRCLHLAYLNATEHLFHLFSPTLHFSCTPNRPLSLSSLPFCFFVPKLHPNSFLRAVLLEFNPPSLPFQPLFHCENLGSDLGPFLESRPAHPPNPPVFCRNPNRGHSLPFLHPFTIQPDPLIPLLITFTTTLSEP